MHLDVTTPAVLFPAVSLLLLAYTNRFLALASVIRRLHADHTANPDPSYIRQIENLRWRIRRVRDMQFCGVLSLLLCTICMFLVFSELLYEAEIVFTLSLLAMIASLIMSLTEIQASVRALDVHLQDLERRGKRKGETGRECASLRP